MKSNLEQMTNTELKHYMSEYRNDEVAFRSALEILLSRRDPNALRHPYPFDLANPESQVEEILKEKFDKS